MSSVIIYRLVTKCVEVISKRACNYDWKTKLDGHSCPADISSMFAVTASWSDFPIVLTFF